MQRKLAGKMHNDEEYKALPGANTTVALAGKKEINECIEHLQDGYFRRDLMKAVAKPGWFDE